MCSERKQKVLIRPELVGRLDGLDCAQGDPMRIAAGFGDKVAQTRQEALVGRTTFEVENLDLHALQYPASTLPLFVQRGCG